LKREERREKREERERVSQFHTCDDSKKRKEILLPLK
jgi:hypothetical protein